MFSRSDRRQPDQLPAHSKNLPNQTTSPTNHPSHCGHNLGSQLGCYDGRQAQTSTQLDAQQSWPAPRCLQATPDGCVGAMWTASLGLKHWTFEVRESLMIDLDS